MWFFSDAAQALMAVGLFLAVIDMLVFGFATFFLTLLGLAMLTSGALMYFGILSSDTSTILISVAVLSAIFGVVLWKPLKGLQNNKENNDLHTDLTGMTFVLEQDISPAEPGKHHYSGLDWKVQSTEELSKGTEVQVIELQVGVMMVKAI